MSHDVLLQEPYRQLLAAHGVDPIQVYTPISLLLLDAGFILPFQTQPERDADGMLPPEAYMREYEQTDRASRRRFKVTLTASPKLGMAYGADSDVVLGQQRLLDQGGYRLGGEIEDISWGRLWAAMGNRDAPRGEDINRMRGALRRMAKTTIESELVYDPVQLSLEIEDGRRHPLIPRRLSLASQMEAESRTRTKIHSILEFEEDYRTGEPGNPDGSYLVRLKLHETIAHTMQVGWLSWIDVPTHNRLRKMSAKYIYQMCARLASRGSATPYDFDFHRDLRPSLMLSEDRKPSHQRDSIEQGLRDLEEVGVLSRFEIERTGRGRATRYRFLLWPGPHLMATGHLRGATVIDSLENRALLLCMSHWGVEGTDAREFIATYPDTSYKTLLYVAYCKYVKKEPIENPAAFVRYAVREGTRFTDEGFVQWAKQQELRINPPADPAQLALPDPAPDTKRPVERFEVENADPEARAWIDRLLEWAEAEEEKPRWRVDLYGVDGVTLEDGTLTVQPETAWNEERVGEKFLGEIETALTDLSDSAITTLRVRPAAEVVEETDAVPETAHATP